MGFRWNRTSTISNSCTELLFQSQDRHLDPGRWTRPLFFKEFQISDLQKDAVAIFSLFIDKDAGKRIDFPVEMVQNIEGGGFFYFCMLESLKERPDHTFDPKD